MGPPPPPPPTPILLFRLTSGDTKKREKRINFAPGGKKRKRDYTQKGFVAMGETKKWVLLGDHALGRERGRKRVHIGVGRRHVHGRNDII